MVHLLHEIPEDTKEEETREDIESCHSQSERTSHSNEGRAVNDQTPLLKRRESSSGHHTKPAKHGVPFSSNRFKAGSDQSQPEAVDDPTKPLAGLNALEIAAVASAKKFLGQRLVQKVVQDIWDGDIVFWESFSVNAVKKARAYNKR